MPDTKPNYPAAPVLVLNPTGNDARNAADVLEKAGIRTEICFTMRDLCGGAGEETGSLLISEEALDRASLDCLVEYLLRQPPWSDIPIILLTLAGDLKQKTHKILDFLGVRANVTLLEKPLRAITLISVVKAALRSRNRQYEVRDLLESYSQATEHANMATAKFRTVFDQSAVFAGIMLNDGKVLESNRLCLDVCGYRAEEVIGRPFWECPWWRCSREAQASIHAGCDLAAQGVPYLEELPYHWADGSQRTISLGVYPIRDSSNQVIFLHATGVDITERQQREQSLREAHQKLQTVLDGIADGLAILDKNWQYTYVNEQGARIVGLTPEDMLGRCVWELFPRSKETKFYEYYQQAMFTGEPVRFEEFYPEPLNMWLECRCYPSSEGLSVFFHNITARKQAENLLRQNEALFSALVEQAPTGVYVVDAQFKLQQVNALAMPAFEKVDVNIGRDFSEVMNILWGATLGAEIVKIFRHTMTTGERYISPRFSEYRQDLGEERAYEWETQRVTLPDGKHGVVCYFNDITERAQAAERLRISEERLRMAARTYGFGVQDYDVRKDHCFWSPELFDLCGIKPGEPITIKTIVGLCHPDDREKLIRAMKASLNTGGLGEFVEEFRISRADNGELRWFYKRCQTFFTGEGAAREPVRNVGVVVDITERKSAETALREANTLLADKAVHLESLVQQRTAKLSETIGELEAFSYSIAHDMRAPLRSLQGFADILITDYNGKFNSDSYLFLQRIAKAAVRMDKLIHDVLNYSRVVRTDFQLEPIDVEQLLRDILETYPMLTPDRVDIMLQGPFPLVLGNEAMLTQIFSNLLGNAAKFVKSGVKPRVKVWAESGGETVRLFVQDNGIGVEAYQHEKIFGIFQQVNKEFDGTGIGLAIVKKAVERMGGKVGLQSEPGCGSTFWIEIKTAASNRPKSDSDGNRRPPNQLIRLPPGPTSMEQ